MGPPVSPSLQAELTLNWTICPQDVVQSERVAVAGQVLATT